MPVIKKCGLVLALLLTAIVSSSALAETIWIDVRSSEEYSQGHLPGAINIIHTEISDKIGTVTQDKNAEIKLYCRSGRRSGLAEAALKELGYTKVQNMGGYEELLAKQPKKP